MSDKPKYVGSIDQGTSSSRFILFDAKGQRVASHQQEFPQHHPESSWTEHDPEDIYQSVVTCIREVMKQGYSASDIAAIGVTNQRETTILWDKVTGKPLYRALVWIDNRSEQIVQKLIQRTGSKDFFRPQCGLPINTYFSATKILWLMENVPEVRKAMAEDRCMFGTVDSWLIYRLSGCKVHVTDVTNASRTMLMDINTCKWSQQVCNYMGIPMSILPKIHSSSEIYCYISDGELRGVPISGCLGDQQSAMVGQLCFRPGSVKNTYGTGCFMLMNTGTKPVQSKYGLLSTVCFKLGADEPTYYALEGSIAVAGLGVKWLKDNLKILGSSDEVTASCHQVGDTGGVSFVPAFSGLMSPHWRPDARGTICGMTLNTTKDHIIRAMVESVAFQSKEVIDAMNADAGHEVTSLKVDGGMTKNDALLQFQADISGVDVLCPSMQETTCLGAALAAGLAVGFYPSIEGIEREIGSNYQAFVPKISAEARANRLKQWKKAIEKSLDSSTPATPTPATNDSGFSSPTMMIISAVVAGALGFILRSKM